MNTYESLSSITQKVAFGILCALKVYQEPGFVNWAERWLNGEDRSAAAAHKASGATWSNYAKSVESDRTKFFLGVRIASRAAYIASCMDRATYYGDTELQIEAAVAELTSLLNKATSIN